MQEFPVAQKLLAMDLRPGFDETFLCLRKAASNAFDRIKGEYSSYVLLVRMKMRSVMRCANLREHTNHDSEESRDLRHRFRCVSSDSSFSG